MQATRQITDRDFDVRALKEPVVLRLLNRILRADARYRAARKLSTLPPERLEDMGIRRSVTARTPQIPDFPRYRW